jgi:2-dehydro-3-deoxyphosphogluconate aldolase/(4S)-4-hydroxy-2-oxoglutarate aldolase
MIQNNIAAVLSQHPIVPVVTVNNEHEIAGIANRLIQQNIRCIEVTLRTDYALEGIVQFKKQFGHQMSVGVGTVVHPRQVEGLAAIGVDFIVSPGINIDLGIVLEQSGIPFIPGVATPSDIIAGMQRDWNVFKFFPANLFGGLPALKAYGQVFPSVQFCPTGGISEATYNEYLELTNVISVGGSWMMK